MTFELQCPCDPVEFRKRQFVSAVARHFSHTEMGFVLPVLEGAIAQLAALDCLVRVPEVASCDAPGAAQPCLTVVSGAQPKEVEALLVHLATAVMAGDPCRLTTRENAYRMFGLLPPKAPGKLAQWLAHCLRCN